MLSKKELGEKLSVLIKKYKVLSESEINGMSEDDTRRRFIDKLLIDVLGWNDDLLESQKSVEIEGRLKHPDYWYPKIPKIIVEAKKANVDLEVSPQFDKQVQDYAYSKAVNWAVLTNFKRFKVWYITRDKIYPFCNIDLVGDRPDHVFETLMWFQNENLLGGEIEEEAKRRGIKLKEIDIAEDFAANLNTLRELINEYFKNNYKRYSVEEREELTQGLINRLIFIKKVESDGIEPNELEQIYRDVSINLYDRIKKVFEQYRKKYDTDIFGRPASKPELETLNIWDEVIKKALETMSKPKGGTEYNFAAIDVDILGTIYENYLAYVQRATELKKEKLERKKHGIYYTPQYIVNFIANNTVGELLDGMELTKAQKIKILDPACGSGSFLIGVINKLDKYYSAKIDDYDKLPASKKLDVIKNNIYGVDLDERATQIAKLSIYLKSLTLSTKNKTITEKDLLLPELKNNIKTGNSLIESLEIAGEKAFEWQKEFDEVFKCGGFDVVLGNPPYVRVDNLNEKDKAYWKNKFSTANGKYDLYYLFIEHALELLKDGGCFGFIVPNKFCAASSAKILRQKLVDSTSSISVISVSHLDVFKDASNYPVILLFKKGQGTKKIMMGTVNEKMELLEQNFSKYYIDVKSLSTLPEGIFPININQTQLDFVLKILKGKEKLRTYLKISEGFRIPEKFEEKGERLKILKQFQFDKWGPIRAGATISEKHLKTAIGKDPERYQNSMKEKIVIAEDALNITAAIDLEKMIPQGGVYFGTLETDRIQLKCLLGLLNSRLLSFVYQVLFGGMHMGGGYLRYRTEFLEHLPIVEIPKDEEEQFIRLVDSIISSKVKLSNIGDKKLAAQEKLNDEINHFSAELDDFVYKLYGISEAEKKMIKTV